MSQLNKNHKARLKRVEGYLDRGVDALMQANGQLWPRELRPYSERLQAAVLELQTLQTEIGQRLESSQVVPDPKDPEPVDPDQVDVEDFEGTDQPEPSQIEELEADEPEPVPQPVTTRRRPAARAA